MIYIKKILNILAILNLTTLTTISTVSCKKPPVWEQGVTFEEFDSFKDYFSKQKIILDEKMKYLYFFEVYLDNMVKEFVDQVENMSEGKKLTLLKTRIYVTFFKKICSPEAVACNRVYTWKVEHVQESGEKLKKMNVIEGLEYMVKVRREIGEVIEVGPLEDHVDRIRFTYNSSSLDENNKPAGIIIPFEIKRA